tara:strand:+ start:1477 stop:4758 length:3282 start_codon:yes stop_codon:yes gene_type:complete
MSQGSNLDLILSTDYLSIEDQKILQEENQQEKISLGEGISLAIQQEQILPSILKSVSQPELEPNYDFRIDDELFDELSKDIDIQYWDEFSNASSKAQAFQIRQRILDAQEANKKLSTLGFTGTALRVGAAILDPAALVADAVTFGLARPFIYANRASRLSKYIRGGLIGSGQAAAITAPVVINDPTRDIDEIGYAAMMGGAITAGLTRFLQPKHPDINKFDAKSQELGKAIEKKTLKEDGFKVTDKGEKYFASDRNPEINHNVNEIDNLTAKNEVMLPTKKIIEDVKKGVEADELLNNFFDRIDTTPEVAGKLRIDKSFHLRKSHNPYMRSASEKLLEDSVGNKDYSRSILTADLHKNNYAATRLTSFYKDYEPAFADYLKEIGKTTKFKSYNLNDRLQFSNLVSRAVRGEVVDFASVTKGSEATKKLFKGMLDDLRKDGVEGAADILDNPNYFPRHWSISRMQDIQESIGYDKVINFLKNSLVKGSIDLSDADGAKLAGHIWRMINTAKFGDGFSVDRLLRTTDETELRGLIGDYTNLDTAEINDLVKVLLKPQKPQVPARLQKRASFDETHEEVIDGKKIKLTDMLDNNTEGVVGAYINQMSGHVAFARVGIKSKNDYGKILDKIKEGYTLPEVAKKYSTRTGQIKQNFELETLETIYKNIIGIPTERNIKGGTATVLRNLRKYNYANVFNQVGFAQIPEMGNIIGTAGVRTFVKYIPEFKNILTRAKDGKLSNEFLDEIETLVSGTGSNRLVDSVINRTDDFAGMTTKVGKVEKTLDVATRITSDFSGFHAVDTLSRRLATITSFDKLARHATGKLKLKPSDIKRYKNIGFSEQELELVFSNIRKNSTFIEGGLTGRKIRRLNVDKWDDQDLVNKMSLYMNRHLRRVIQENNYGEMVALGADSSLGKTLLQFRNFVITAYAKQLQHGLHMRDFTFFSSVMTSTMLASLVYVSQQYIQAIGKTGEERDEFLEERLSPEAIGGATFQRNTYATLLPPVIDTALYYSGNDTLFNYRSSGLETNLWTGNPTYSLVQKTGGAIRSTGKAVFDDEYDFSKRDAYKWLRILPYQNMLGVRNVLQYMIDESDLPKTSN